MKSICDQYIQWALEAINEWDGLHTHELFTLIAEKTGESPNLEFASGRDATTNERHLLNLLSWREAEARSLWAEIERLRQLLAEGRK